MKDLQLSKKIKEINLEHMCFKHNANQLEIFHHHLGFTGFVNEVFDFEGRKIEYERRDYNGGLSFYESNSYDLKGNLLLKKTMDEGYNKCITQNIYNFNNKLIQSIGYEADGSQLFTKEYFYDSENNLQNTLQNYDDIQITESFRYDSQLRLIESNSVVKYKDDGQILVQTILEFEYCAETITKKKYYSKERCPLLIDEISIYDLNNRLLVQNYFIDAFRDYRDENEEFHYTEKFQYDNDSDLITQKIQIDDKQNIEITTNTYEKKNLIVQHVCNSTKNNILNIEQTKYEYEFDEHGNWIEKYVFFDKNKLNINSLSEGTYYRRKIQYY